MNTEIAPIGTVINMVSINICDGTGRFGANNYFTEKSSKVLLNNGKKVVLDDEDFSSVGLVDSYGAQLEKPIVHLRINDPDYGNNLGFLLYTERNLSKEEIKDMISEGIKESLKSAVSFDESYIMEAIDSESSYL